ncbi:hypothetical protein AAFC00_002511 [Neodothiora populina]
MGGSEEVRSSGLDANPDADAQAQGNGNGASGEEGETGLEGFEPDVPERVTFLDYLKSPIVALAVGSGDEATTLYAHQGLLVQSPYFSAKAAELRDDANAPRSINLESEDLVATASFLEYIYKGDYFPTILASTQTLEDDPTVPSPDDSGLALLRHARVYTLAQRFGLPQLASLAHKKIHLTASTACGEIAYARYVYANTQPTDESIRKPVAAFWATRSHVLRHEAEREFRTMCLEFPQFGFDVLSLVLDAQEKRSVRAGESSVGGNSRKRPRASQSGY